MSLTQLDTVVCDFDGCSARYIRELGNNERIKRSLMGLVINAEDEGWLCGAGDGTLDLCPEHTWWDDDGTHDLA